MDVGVTVIQPRVGRVKSKLSLPVDLFIEGNLYCRDLANSFVKTESFIDLPREGRNLSSFVSVMDIINKLPLMET